MPTSDRHWFLAGGRPAREASSLWTGDHSALKDPSVPLGLLRRAGRPVFFCPSKSAPAFLFVPSCSFFVPSRPLSRLLEGGKPRAGNSIPAGQRPAGICLLYTSDAADE